MTAEDIRRIESSLGIALPERYRDLMLAYPLDPRDSNSQIALLGNASEVIAFNRFLREQFPDEWGGSSFAIGNSPCGDPYFLELTGGDGAVSCWDHETHEATVQSRGLDEWVALQRSFERGGG